MSSGLRWPWSLNELGCEPDDSEILAKARVAASKTPLSLDEDDVFNVTPPGKANDDRSQ
jgi:hypothetical protein